MLKSIKLNCDCIGGGKYCSEIKVADYGDKDVDLLLIDKAQKVRVSIYLNEKSIKKIISYLQKVICLTPQFKAR